MAFFPLPGLREFTFLTKMGGFFKKLVTSVWFYVALAFLALSIGTFFYLKTDKNNAVEEARTQATEQANNTATIRSFEIESESARRVNQIDQDFQAKRERTIEDFSNVRNTVNNAPIEERDASAPALLIDTLNELDRMQQNRRNED